MRIRLLQYELPTRQAQHLDVLKAVGADISTDDTDNDEEVAWGSDPFDIIAHREELGQINDH